MIRTRIVALAAAGVLALALAGCADGGTEPGGSAGPTDSGSETPAPSTPSEPSGEPTPDASPTPTVSTDISLPGSCEQIYSAGMLAQLGTDNPPLNDPGVTMYSTGIEDLFTLIEGASAAGNTIRCSWGMPSEYGLATNVSIVTPAQAEEVVAAAQAGGLDCAEYRMGTLCRIVVQNDEEMGGNAYGETHFLAGNGWVSTAWLNFAPDGYTEDIVGALWG